ncbi:glycoside hydrolase family 97 N-terminal domain-containing protein [Archangium minus]|uniref:glycoside hydrolase family 97 N-terminal domain-containing protein n=1 Tax=Archangium minus TaxID=83450 RepID=UPI0037C01AB7
MTETRLAFANASGARLDLLVRVSADGVAYRYEVPNSTGVTVTSEASAFSVPATSTAWLLPYNAQYEQARLEKTAGAAPARDYGYPSLFKVGDSFVLLTEADVDGRYAGSRLVHKGSGAYQVVLADAQVHASGALRTPWRTAIIGDLATVTESTLVDDLASPARITDTLTAGCCTTAASSGAKGPPGRTSTAPTGRTPGCRVTSPSWASSWAPRRAPTCRPGAQGNSRTIADVGRQTEGIG